MASRYFNQFVFSLNNMLTYIEGSAKIAASGNVAPSSACVGSGITGITKTGTGQYQVQLQDDYNRLVGFEVELISPTSAAGSIADGSLTIGLPYQVVFPSTSTNWVTLGVPASITPVQGVPFVATSGASIGAAVGTPGTVIPITNTGIIKTELLPNPNTVIGATGSSSAGGFINFQTLNGSNAPTNPTSGTVLRFNAFLRNSSRLGSNETSSNY